ncbi:hypothetical protein [Polycyclovorans algicola]|uniref:hypothetical protein n=1 Tax=Polycyclovorans algicola TaxID=616992 RepID=UPI0004A6F0DF|nr:hypothetical protein [Polycyclovorans algicola]
MKPIRLLWGMALGWSSVPATADIWTEPNPVRREALVEGRRFDYNTESFLHRLSFGQLSRTPYSDEDGLSGTVGSTRSDEFYVDMFLHKRLVSDDGRHVAFIRMQRSEDFDGRFDRQIVGYGHHLGDWRLAIAGDVRGDKAEIDVQYELQWQPDPQSRVRLALIQPDAFFNDKEGADGEYTKSPNSFFAHARFGDPEGWALESALTYSPPSQFNDQVLGVEARGDQVRAMLQVDMPVVAGLRPTARVEVDNANREFAFSDRVAPEADTFQRRMQSLRLMFEHRQARLRPVCGVHHLRLRERGWFGDARGTSGLESRDELLGFAGIRQRLSERWTVEPTVYAGRARAIQDQMLAVGDGDVPQRDDNDLHGKLALPFRYVLDEARGGVLTLNPTLRLHRAAFGGGNVQVHWPF